jgi:hypothetical protein
MRSACVGQKVISFAEHGKVEFGRFCSFGYVQKPEKYTDLRFLCRVKNWRVNCFETKKPAKRMQFTRAKMEIF